jgi:hypothetical protein
MAVVSSTGRKVGKKLGHVGRRRAFYASPTITAEAEHAGYVHVNLSIRPDWVRTLSRVAGPTGLARAEGEGGSAEAAKAATEALKAAASELLAHDFAAEIGRVVGAYRLMLRESFAKGEDPELVSALNRARLQERILSGTTMVDQAQACQLLGLSGAPLSGSSWAWARRG